MLSHSALVLCLVLQSAAPQQVVDLPNAPSYIVQEQAAVPVDAVAAGEEAIPKALGGPVVPQIPPGQEINWGMKVAREAWVAAKDGNWGVFVSVVLMAALSLFSFLFVRSKELRDRLRQWMPEVALAVSVLGYVAVGCAAVPKGAALADWWEVIGPALKTGFGAVGAYEILIKRAILFWWPKLSAAVKALWVGVRKK